MIFTLLELQFNKANVSDTEASFLDLHLSISDGFVKTKCFDKRDDFDFDIVNFPFLDGDDPRSITTMLTFDCTTVGRSSDWMMVPS